MDLLLKNLISPILIGGFVKMAEHYFIVYNMYPPYWFEGQGVILEQQVCLTNPIKIRKQKKIMNKKSLKYIYL